MTLNWLERQNINPMSKLCKDNTSNDPFSRCKSVQQFGYYSANKYMESTDESYSNTGYEPKNYDLMELMSSP